MVHRSSIGVGVAYYGSAHPRHLSAQRALLYEGIPVFTVTGCAYPEMALAEIAREALEAKAAAAVFLSSDVVFDAKDVRRLGQMAIDKKTVVTASAGRSRTSPNGYHAEFERSLRFSPSHWDPNLMGDMDFTAVPLEVFKTLAALDPRTYTNSSVIRSAMGDGLLSRPFFSPWNKRENTLLADPISPGIYSTPDRAFFLRVQDAGFQIERVSMPLDCVSKGGMSLRIIEGKPDKRELEGVNYNYAVCVPCWGALDLEQQAALWELEKAGVTIIEVHGCPYIDLARSILKRIAIDNMGCDGVFFLDHDIIFRPCDLLDVIYEAEARQDVVSGIYCMRKTAHALIGAPDIPQEQMLGFFELGEVVPALYSGLGFSAVPKCVFEALDPLLPLLDSNSGKVRPYFALDVNHDFYCGEDASFCGRVQGLAIKSLPPQAAPSPQPIPGQSAEGHRWELTRDQAPTKHRVYIDTRQRIFHKGSYHYGIEDHSMAVPRLANLKAKHCSTREDMLSFFKFADEFNLDVRARTQGLDEGATAGHGILK